MKALLIVNFGGPRNLEEIESFLIELLTDRDVVRNNWPSFIHRPFFTLIAKRRAKKIAHDYGLIGGKSPIFQDTEIIASNLREVLKMEVFTFHRYLPNTHASSIKQLELSSADEIIVLPLFPQFSYATTGSIAKFLAKNLCKKTLLKLRWIHSYAEHPLFISSWISKIKTFIEEKKLKNPFLLFSAHGLPQFFVCKGDPYESECIKSYEAIKKEFPNSSSLLSFQSKFGKGRWLQPYTEEVCQSNFFQNQKDVVIVPLSFTSDHIETLFEIEKLYLPLIQEKGINAFRCPALNLDPKWIEALSTICQSKNLPTTSMLVRHDEVEYCCGVRG